MSNIQKGTPIDLSNYTTLEDYVQSKSGETVHRDENTIEPVEAIPIINMIQDPTLAKHLDQGLFPDQSQGYSEDIILPEPAHLVGQSTELQGALFDDETQTDFAC